MSKVKKGDIVKVQEAFCYAKWSRFALLHPQYAIRYAYGHFPNELRDGYEVIGVHGDVVVVRGTDCKVDKKSNPIYFVQEDGVEVIG